MTADVAVAVYTYLLHNRILFSSDTIMEMCFLYIKNDSLDGRVALAFFLIGPCSSQRYIVLRSVAKLTVKTCWMNTTSAGSEHATPQLRAGGLYYNFIRLSCVKEVRVENNQSQRKRTRKSYPKIAMATRMFCSKKNLKCLCRSPLSHSRTRAKAPARLKLWGRAKRRKTNPPLRTQVGDCF